MRFFLSICFSTIALLVTLPTPSFCQMAPAPKRVTFDRSFDHTFAKSCVILKDSKKISITVDQEAFEKRQGKHFNLSEKNVQVRRRPNHDIPEALLVELVAQQVGAVARFDQQKNTYVLSPGRRSLASILAPPDPRIATVVLKPRSIRAFANVPLQDLVEFFEDRFELTILLDETTFPKRADGEKLDKATCSVPAGINTIIDALDHVARQIDGQVILKDKVIIISCLPKEKS